MNRRGFLACLGLAPAMPLLTGQARALPRAGTPMISDIEIAGAWEIFDKRGQAVAKMGPQDRIFLSHGSALWPIGNGSSCASLRSVVGRWRGKSAGQTGCMLIVERESQTAETGMHDEQRPLPVGAMSSNRNVNTLFDGEGLKRLGRLNGRGNGFTSLCQLGNESADGSSVHVESNVLSGRGLDCEADTLPVFEPGPSEEVFVHFYSPIGSVSQPSDVEQRGRAVLPPGDDTGRDCPFLDRGGLADRDEAYDATPAVSMPAAQDEGRPVKAGKALIDEPVRVCGAVVGAGQIKEFVTAVEAGEEDATPIDPASIPDIPIQTPRPAEGIQAGMPSRAPGGTAGASGSGEIPSPAPATEIRPCGGSRPEGAASLNAPGLGEGGRKLAQGYSAVTEARQDSDSRTGRRNEGVGRSNAGASAEPIGNLGHDYVTVLGSAA